MDGLSEGLRWALGPALEEELKLYLENWLEEAQEKERILNSSLEQLLGDIKGLEKTKKAQEEEWQKERAGLKAALGAAKQEPLEQNRDTLMRLRSEAQTRTEEFEKEREKRYALEWEIKRVTCLVEQKEEEAYDKMMAKATEHMMVDSDCWSRQTKEKELCSLDIALSAATKKQMLLSDTKSKVENWMVSAEPTLMDSISSGTLPVFQTWRMREEWRKLQGNKACLNDGLQSFIKRRAIEKIIIKNQALEGQINSKFEATIQRCRAEAMKKQAELRAAELKKRSKLEQQIKKQMEKIQKAELKKKQKQEAKERKEAEKLEKRLEKLEKKRAKEEKERTKSRRLRFCFWRSSSASQEDD